MHDLDKAGRYLLKRDAAGGIGWLLGQATLPVHAWIDARRLALPDQRDLTHDLVAALRTAAGFEALCVELHAAAQGDALMRQLGYQTRLLTEPGDAHSLTLEGVGGVILNLTGRGPAFRLARELQADARCRLELTVVVRNLCDEDAGALLAGVASGTVSAWALGWIPLCRGGHEPGIIRAWRREAARRLTEERDRADLAVVALTFATLAGCQRAWQSALREWNMQTSPFLDEFRARFREEGRTEGRTEGHTQGRTEEARALLLRQGRKKFGKPPTRKQQQALAAITELVRLEALAERLLDVTSWADLLAAP